MSDPAHDAERVDAARPDTPEHGPPPRGGEEAGPADGTEAPPPAQTWAELFPPRPKPEGVDYGFLSARGEPVPSTRENLLHLVRTRALPSLAWSPETAEIVAPWEVPFLLGAMRDDLVAAAERERRIVLGVAGALVLGSWVLAPAWVAGLLTFGAALAVLGLSLSIGRRIRLARALTAQQVRAGFDAMAAQQAEAARPVPATRAVGTALIATGAVQLLMMDASVEAGGLRRDAVMAGEAWRLFTAPMLHANVLHFWMNYGALESLGRTLETRGTGPWVPLVFLASALAGGVASMALPPDVTSVGASGGLMGMFGFLAVMAWRRKRHLPEGFLRALVINITLIAGLGIVAYRFIDNAAHAGGLAAGVLLGLAAVPDDARVPRWTAGPRLERAGRAATWMVRLSAAAAIAATLLRALGGG